MKSKTVASILRHVASKLPSASVEAEAEAVDAPAAEPVEKESKKARRARQAAGEEEIPDQEIPGGGPNEEERLEMLYDTIGWPLGKKYGHPYDAFKLALTLVPRRTLQICSDTLLFLGRPMLSLLHLKNPSRHLLIPYLWRRSPGV